VQISGEVPGNDCTSVRGGGGARMPCSAQGRAKSMLIILFDIKGIVHKEFVLAGQIVASA
jgi:hypothetical protein